MRVTIPVRIAGIVSVLGDSLESRFAAVIGTTLGCLNMPDPRLMCGAEVQSQQQEFQPAGRAFSPDIELAFPSQRTSSGSQPQGKKTNWSKPDFCSFRAIWI